MSQMYFDIRRRPIGQLLTYRDQRALWIKIGDRSLHRLALHRPARIDAFLPGSIQRQIDIVEDHARRIRRHRHFFQSVAVENGALHIRYTRAINAPCSMVEDGAGCWANLLRSGAIPHLMAQTPPPVEACAAAYRKESRPPPAVCENLSARGGVVGSRAGNSATDRGCGSGRPSE
jgi:hypothetical protein